MLALLSATPSDAASLESAARTVDARLPRDWKRIAQTDNATPRGFVDRRVSGIKLQYEGRKITYTPFETKGEVRFHHRGKERLTLWIVPASFTAKPPGQLWLLFRAALVESSAELVGGNETVKVFAWDETGLNSKLALLEI
jgi:hypothetical protein